MVAGNDPFLPPLPGIAFANTTASFAPAFLPNSLGTFSDLLSVVSVLDSNGLPVPRCQMPAPVKMIGTGGATSLIASPTHIDFGSPTCGSAPDARTVDITNEGGPTSATAKLRKGSASPFTLSLASDPAPSPTSPTVSSLDIPNIAPLADFV